MITIKHTTHGLFLVGHGTAAMVACDDPAALASAIRRIIASPMPILRSEPARRPSWSKPLFAERDAEDRRRVALSEERAALQALRARRPASTPAQLGQRLADARARYLVEV